VLAHEAGLYDDARRGATAAELSTGRTDLDVAGNLRAF